MSEATRSSAAEPVLSLPKDLPPAARELNARQMAEQSKGNRVNSWRILRRSRVLLLATLALVALASAACIQQSNTYPVEVFKEMHYAQFQSSQEPPRILPPAESVAFVSAGGPEAELNVPAIRERPYDPEVAGELYQVNCAVCHGVTGQGDGPAARHIASPNSYWATTTGAPYNAPPDLTQTAFTPEAAFLFIGNGSPVMPRFSKLMSEEDIRDIVAYVFDGENGLGAGQ